jgi:tetratricopeptide (TPR) repeat protein
MAASDPREGFDLDQALELFRGDTAAGLREFKAFVDANPSNRPARQRIAAIVADRAKELEDGGSRDEALSLYEQASTLRGDAAGSWASRIPVLRRALSADAYDRAMRVYRSDLAQAVKLLEASVKHDPANALAVTRLREARTAQRTLSRIEQGGRAR